MIRINGNVSLKYINKEKVDTIYLKESVKSDRSITCKEINDNLHNCLCVLKNKNGYENKFLCKLKNYNPIPRFLNDNTIRPKWCPLLNINR